MNNQDDPNGAADSTAKGLEMMDRVYGPGFGATMPDDRLPLTEHTIDHLFGEIWSRPGLSIRDRRLLVMGATAAFGRGDLLEVQIRGALANDELTEEQLHEAVLHLSFYVGIVNAGPMHAAVLRALADRTPSQPT
jgi:4-carboxymuconolactone decarboxylase